MNNYCGFIEVWKCGCISGLGMLLPFNLLEEIINTPEYYSTVAIFKIKLKNNEQKRNN